MRRAATILVLILALVPATQAANRRNWNNVESLKPGAPLAVFLWNGEKIHGLFVSAEDSGIRLDAYGRFPLGTRRIRQITRRDIRKIVLVRAEQGLPDPGKWAKRGALAGGAVGLGVGIYKDSKHGSSCQGLCWLVDGAAGAGAGYMGALFAVGIDGMGHLFRRGKVVYEAAKPGPSPHTENRH